jgi:hypothetical protein
MESAVPVCRNSVRVLPEWLGRAWNVRNPAS